MFKARRCVRGRHSFENRAGTALGLVLSALAGPAVAQMPSASPAPASNAAAPTSASNVELPAVVVGGDQMSTEDPTSYRVRRPSVPRLTQPLLDTPQSITVVPRQVIQDQAATTVQQALRNVTGISLAAGEGGVQGDNLTLRGFTAASDFYLDSMRDSGNYFRDPFNLDRIEVLKGPSSILFGRGSTGGVINQVSKTPMLESFVAGTASLGMGPITRLTADANAPVSALGPNAAFRMNVMAHRNEVVERDEVKFRRFGVAPSLALGLGTPTRLFFNYFHQSENNVPDYGIPFFFGRPPRVDRDNYYGLDSDTLETHVNILTAKIEHDFNETLSVRSQARYARYARLLRIAIPSAISGPGPEPDPDTVTVATPRRRQNGYNTFVQDQTDLTARFSTLGIPHIAVVGFEVGLERSEVARRNYDTVPGTNLADPDPDRPYASATTRVSDNRTKANSQAVFALDTIELGRYFQLNGGIRWDRFDADFRNSVSGEEFDRVDSKVSWRGALVFKPVEIGSVYFAYGTSFNPSAEALTFSAANADLPPEENETFELGTKWEVLDDRLLLRGALFRQEKTNARTPDPDDPTRNILAGELRVDGFELEGAGRVTDNWQVLAGYTFLDGEIRESNTAGEEGNRTANTPKHTFNLWTTYALPWDLEIGGGAQHVSRREGNNANTTSVPGFWRFDAMAKYRLTERVDLQLNVFNLTDKRFYEGVYPSRAVPGAGRTVLFTTLFQF